MGVEEFSEFFGRGWLFEFGFEVDDDLPEKFPTGGVVDDFWEWEWAWDEEELGWFHF